MGTTVPAIDAPPEAFSKADSPGGLIRQISYETTLRTQTRMTSVMESATDAAQPRPVLGPTVIPTVSAPVHEPVGHRVRFRHIDSSGSSMASGSGQARGFRAELARSESYDDVPLEGRVPEVIIHPPQSPVSEEDSGETEGNDTPSDSQSCPTALASTNTVRRNRVCAYCVPIILATLLSLAILAIIGIVIAWAATTDRFKHISRNTMVCASSECVDIASTLTTSLDTSIASCQNFYRRSCGKFHAEHPSPTGELYNYKNVLDERLENYLNDLLTRPVIDQGNGIPFAMEFSRNMYSQCKDFALREQIGTEPLLNLLRNQPCGPLFSGCSGFNRDRYVWERAAGMADVYAKDLNLIVLDRGLNPLNTAEIVLAFKAPDLSKIVSQARQRALLLQPDLSSEFDGLLSVALKTGIVNDTFVRLLGEKYTNSMSNEFDELVQFIVSINDLATSARESNEQPISMTVQAFLEMIAPIDIKAFLDASVTMYHNWGWVDNVVIHNPAYFRNLSAITVRTEPRTIANYFTFVNAVSLRPLLQVESNPTEWRTCLKQMSNLDPVASAYANTRPPLNFDRIAELFNELKLQFIDADRAHTPQTRDFIRRMVVRVGAPPRLYSDSSIAEEFSRMQVQEDSFEQRIQAGVVPWPDVISDYFNTFVEAQKRQRGFELAQIGSFRSGINDGIQWNSLSNEMQFDNVANELVIPLGLLQGPPVAVPTTQVPALSILATSGVLFLSKLEEIASHRDGLLLAPFCVQQLFSSFLFNRPSNPDDAVLPTLAFANTSVHNALRYSEALTIAFSKHSEWRNLDGSSYAQAIPSMTDLSHEELGFLEFGVLMCSTEAGNTPGISEYEAMINTALTMEPTFQKAFKCSIGSPMRPEGIENCGNHPFIEVLPQFPA
uniref:Peptidase_M13_N domain-containing protein n=1 Tax=Panagrellus redivivus TaxID=6233 RepID=A0A7E4UQT2_PANRE